MDLTIKKMSGKSIIGILFLISYHSLFAQLNIRGDIRDSEGKPIEYASVQLLVDSVYEQSVLSDSLGAYGFQTTNNTGLELRVNRLGYLPAQQKFKAGKDTTINFVLKTDTTILEAVTITGNKSLIQSAPDRIIVNMKGNINIKGKETTGILQYLPTLHFANGKLQMFGKSSLLVYINDHIVRLSGQDLTNYLNTLPPENIENVEIISTPPAEYDAAGNAGIVKIKTRKNIHPGWKEYFKSAYIKNTYSSGIFSAFVSYSGKKFYMDASIAGGRYASLNQSNYFNYFPGETVSTFNPKKWIYAGAKTKFNLGYNLNRHSTLILDMQIPLYKQESVSDLENRMDFYKPGSQEADSSIFSNGNTVKKDYTYDGEIFFKHRFSNRKSYFTASAAYLGNDTKNLREFTSITQINNISSETENYRTQGNQDYNIISSKVDFSFPLMAWEANTGVKLSSVRTRSNNDFYVFTDGVYEPVAQFSNRYQYSENVQSLYLSLKTNSGAWSFKGGIRSEMTHTVSKSATQTTPDKNKYLDFFPSLYISLKAGHSNRISLSYAKRIERPPYQYLDPFRWYISKYDYATGNPFLSPSYIHNLECNYLYESTFSAKIFISRQKDKIGRYVVLDSLDVKNQVQKADNFLNINTYGINLYKSFHFFDWFQTVLQANFSYIDYFSNKKEFSDISGTNGTIIMNNTFLLDEKMQFTLNMEENIPGLYDYRMTENSFRLDIGANYIISRKGLEIRTQIRDLFRTANPDYYYVSSGIKQLYHNYFDSQMLEITLTWRPGNWFNRTPPPPPSSNTEEKQRLK